MPNQPASNPIAQQSAGDFIASGLRLCGAIGSGQPVTASEYDDGQMVLNQMLDAWAAERVLIFTTSRVIVDQNNVALSLVGGKQNYTLGNALGTEDFYLPRPARLERASVMYSASQSTPVEVPLEMYDDVDWQGISNKSTTSILPEGVYNDLGFPDMTLSFWPVPTQANPIALYPWQNLQLFNDLTTKLSFPPGYAEAIRFNLAIRLGAEFPGDPAKMPLIMRLAKQSRDRIASFNAPTKVATVGQALMSGRASGNIYTGTSSRGKNY